MASCKVHPSDFIVIGFYFRERIPQTSRSGCMGAKVPTPIAMLIIVSTLVVGVVIPFIFVMYNEFSKKGSTHSNGT